LHPLIEDFKNFAIKGNVLDMAVGIVIGVAFTGIVNSLVKDIIMPSIGMITGGINFADRFVPLDGVSYANITVAQMADAPIIRYGMFINAIINFLIVALAMFLVIRVITAYKKTPQSGDPNTYE
jgi:large conductance mechanosensitive channel